MKIKALKTEEHMSLKIYDFYDSEKKLRYLMICRRIKITTVTTVLFDT